MRGYTITKSQNQIDCCLEYDFIGIAGEKSIQSNFLNTWLIKSDFNHQNGTDREVFQIVQNRVTAFEKNGYWYKVKQESTRANNTLGEILTNPVLLTIPKILKSTVEYLFPSVLVLYGEALTLLWNKIQLL